MEIKDKYYQQVQATQRSLRQEPQMDTTDIYIYIYIGGNMHVRSRKLMDLLHSQLIICAM